MNCLCYMPTTRKIGCTPRLNQFVSERVVLYRNILCIKTTGKARFKRHATAVPNSVDRIKFDFSTAIARRLKSGRATAVLHGSSSTWFQTSCYHRAERNS